MVFAKDDDVIEALAPDRSDEAFRVAEGLVPRAKDARKQGHPRTRMHDGWPEWPDSDLIVVTTGK